MDKQQSKNQPMEDGPIWGGALGDELTCEEYRGEIPLVIGGDLEQEVLDLLVAHLAACEPCADMTALAARARAALQAGLDGEAQAWRKPQLWSEVRARLAQESEGRIDVAVGPQPLAPILRFTKTASKVVLPLAAAVALFVMLKTDESSHSRPASGEPSLLGQPSHIGQEEQLVQMPTAVGAPVASGGTGWFNGTNASQFAVAGASGDPQQEFATLTGAVPPGLLEPLSREDQRELERASRLRVDLDAERNLLRIRQGSAVLTSLPYSH